MAMPDTLAEKIALFRDSGRVFREHEELFTELSWIQVFIGQNIIPRRWHPMVEALGEHEIAEFMAGIKGVLERSAAAMPLHRDFFVRHCKAEPPPMAKAG
jgi:tryptophan halogenase